MCNCSCHPEDFPSLAEMQETQRRFFVFIARLKARLCGYADAALPDLLQAHAADTDLFKRPSQRQKAGFAPWMRPSTPLQTSGVASNSGEGEKSASVIAPI